MSRGVRVLTIGAVGALLVGLTSAVFEDRAEIHALQGQVAALNVAAASSTRITINRYDNGPQTVCESISNDSARTIQIVMTVSADGRAPDPSVTPLPGRHQTAWCVDN